MIEQIEPIDKKEQILIEAERLFSEQDFDAVSVRDLAKAANVNVAMISYYFGSKEKLFEALIIRRISASHAILRDMVKAGTDNKQKIFFVIDYYIDKFIDNRSVHRMINRELSSNNRPHLRELIMEKMRINREFIKSVIEDGVKEGEFSPDMDIDMTIMNFFATTQHTVGASYYSCAMFNKETEEALFTPDFKDRLKKYFKDLFTHNLLTNH